MKEMLRKQKVANLESTMLVLHWVSVRVCFGKSVETSSTLEGGEFLDHLLLPDCEVRRYSAPEDYSWRNKCRMISIVTKFQYGKLLHLTSLPPRGSLMRCGNGVAGDTVRNS